MKICPTCQKQFPNGFQYCPNDTDLLRMAEEDLRQTQIVSPVTVKPREPVRTERVPAEPVLPVLDVTRQTEALGATTPVRPAGPAREDALAAELPFRGERPAPIVSEPAHSQPLSGSAKKTTPITTVGVTARVGRQEPPRTAAEASKVEGGMSFILPEEGNILRRLKDGFGQFLSTLGKSAPKGEQGGPFSIQQEVGLFKRLKDNASLSAAFVGKAAPSGDNAFLVPESGSILKRLRESSKTFVDDFGKKAPEPKPGELGEFVFLLRDDPIYTRVGREVKSAAIEFRKDPKGFAVSVLKGDGTTRRRLRLLQAGVATAMIAYAFIFTSFLLGGLFNFGKKDKSADELEVIGQLTMPSVDVKDAPKETPRGKGGFTGGSKPKVEQARGGGGGGREQVTPPSKGVPPQMSLTQQILPPNPEPPKIKNPSLPVPSTVYGDPKALPDLKGPIGDPLGAPAPPSSGPGTIAGIGRGDGTGVGPGSGGGVGPGSGGNAGGRDMSLGGGRGPGGSGGILDMGRDGVGRIQILSKEKAKYTEEARQNKVQGTVVLSAVFTNDGQVTSVRVIRGLPDGLTEKAIEAAKKIRFQPATKNGMAVTVRGQLEFTFNLY